MAVAGRWLAVPRRRVWFNFLALCSLLVLAGALTERTMVSEYFRLSFCVALLRVYSRNYPGSRLGGGRCRTCSEAGALDP